MGTKNILLTFTFRQIDENRQTNVSTLAPRLGVTSSQFRSDIIRGIDVVVVSLAGSMRGLRSVPLTDLRTEM